MTSSTTPLPTSYLPPVPANALLYQRAILNPIGVTAASSTSIGYLAANVSQLEVVGQLTAQDPTDIYNFTFQSGTAINAHLTTIDGSVAPHIQLYDGSGTRILADNQGNSTQVAAFNALTSTNGLAAKTGQYVIKVTYGAGASKNTTQNYAFQLDSGTTFTNDYRTLASPTTISATLLAGGSVGYNSALLTASLLTNSALGTSINIFGTIANNSSNSISVFA